MGQVNTNNSRHNLEKRIQWFRQARFGMFIHWGLYSVPAKGEWSLYYDDTDYDEYEAYAETFNPTEFDPDAWAELARESGMQYVVFTTKHHDSFCMFETKLTDYKITNTPYGKDVTALLVEAFRKRGIRIGLYHSLVDWRHPHFVPDDEHPLWKRGQQSFPGRDMAVYLEYLYGQVREILSQYGKIDLLFFDYTSKWKTSDDWQADKMLELVYSLQPDIIVNDRLCYHKSPLYGDYCTPEICLPNQQVSVDGTKRDWETCMTLNDHWGFCADDNNYKSAANGYPRA